MIEIIRDNSKKLFEIFFGYIEINTKYKSPLRNDKNPGAMFSEEKGVMYFLDFADTNRTTYDIIGFIGAYYGVKFNQAIDIGTWLLYMKTGISNVSEKTYSEPSRSTTIIIPRNRTITLKDKQYWDQFGITEENLKEDSVYPISSYFLSSAKGSWVIDNIPIQTYAIYYEDIGKVKVYSPYGYQKIITNVPASYICGSFGLSFNHIIITKGYKEYRILKNLNYNVCYVATESTFSLEKLYGSTKSFEHIYTGFDNDEVGQRATKKVIDYFAERNKKITPLLFEEKDIADSYIKKEVNKSFIKNTII